MPLILLGLLVVIGIVIYALVQYGQSEDVDTRPVRERYPHVFNKIDDTVGKFRKDANYTVIDDEEDDVTPSSGGGNTIHFPDDAELEKRKRDIT